MSDAIAEKTNAAFQTAKLTSYWLELAGLPEAVEYSRLIHLDQELDPKMILHSRDMCFLNPVIHEIRYGSINAFIERSGCRNILDIACGYSPRGLLFARKGYHYVGADLPVVAEQLCEVVRELHLEGLEYVGADATNYDSLKAAFDRMSGPVCIVVEGLGMYLSAHEAETVRRNITCLLSEREGSCYVTTDPGNGYLFHAVITSLYPPNQTMMRFGQLFEMYNWASDGGITYETAKRPIEDDIEMYRRIGMTVEMVPLLPEGTRLRAFDRLPEEAVQALSKAMTKPLLLTGSAAGVVSVKTEKDEVPFSLESKKTDGMLQIKVSGRLDSLSAPELMRCFESSRDEIDRVVIDLSDTSFVSAAGGRVFYQIRKALGEDNRLILKGQSGEVAQEIETDDIIRHVD